MSATERAYRLYVTEQLRLIPQMSYLSASFGDVMGYTNREPERDPEEIVDGIIARLEA